MAWRNDIIESTYRELKRPALHRVTEISSFGRLQITGVEPAENSKIQLLKDDLVTMVGTCVKVMNAGTQMKIKIVITSEGEMGWLWPNETEKV